MAISEECVGTAAEVADKAHDLSDLKDDAVRDIIKAGKVLKTLDIYYGEIPTKKLRELYRKAEKDFLDALDELIKCECEYR